MIADFKWSVFNFSSKASRLDFAGENTVRFWGVALSWLLDCTDLAELFVRPLPLDSKTN